MFQEEKARLAAASKGTIMLKQIQQDMAAEMERTAAELEVFDDSTKVKRPGGSRRSHRCCCSTCCCCCCCAAAATASAATADTAAAPAPAAAASPASAAPSPCCRSSAPCLACPPCRACRQRHLLTSLSVVVVTQMLSGVGDKHEGVQTGLGKGGTLVGTLAARVEKHPKSPISLPGLRESRHTQ